MNRAKELAFFAWLIFWAFALSYHLLNAQTATPFQRGFHIYSDTEMVFVSKDDSIKIFGWVTDSIKWVAIDTTFEGDLVCKHDWVFGEPDIAGMGLLISCLVDHQGQHCDFDDDVREKICRNQNCLRGVIEREKWFQHFVAPPKSEFEVLKEKQRAKQ